MSRCYGYGIRNLAQAAGNTSLPSTVYSPVPIIMLTLNQAAISSAYHPEHAGVGGTRSERRARHCWPPAASPAGRALYPVSALPASGDPRAVEEQSEISDMRYLLLDSFPLVKNRMGDNMARDAGQGKHFYPKMLFPICQLNESFMIIKY